MKYELFFYFFIEQILKYAVDQLLSQKLVGFKTDITVLHTCIESKEEESHQIRDEKLD